MIKAENLCKIYGKGENEVRAMDNMSLTIEDGEIAAIIGKSGSGKTTLLNLLGGLDAASSGSVFYDETEITKMNDAALSDFRLREIGFVFQFFDLLPELTAKENILLPARLSGNKQNDLQNLANTLGIADRLNHYPFQLSGGQQQRAAIARALINNPKILLCDEPTGNLDEKSGREVMELLLKMNREQKKTILIVTHNPEIAEQCDRIIDISDGRIVSDN